MGVRFVIRSAEGRALPEELAYGFEQARIVIGRGAGADVRIPHLTVSETHATVRFEGDGYAILDNDSTNGTRVNGTRLVPGRGKRLREGDLIEVGIYSLSFHPGVALANATTVERTSELARRLFREAQSGASLGDPRLCVLSGPDTGKSLDIPSPPARFLIGRAASCQLVLADAGIAEQHAEVRRDLDGVLICGLAEGPSLDINGQRVRERRLRDGDELLIGATRVLFEEPVEEPIDNLGGEGDVKLGTQPPWPAAPLSGTSVAPDLAAVPSAAQTEDSAPPPAASGRVRKGPRAGWDADFLIYALAAIVIALSVAGLIVLMRGN